MKILGIIAEYNPFHLGHAFHLKEALKITDCDAAVIIMSGDYVQRGEPAIFPKHLRTQMALSEGASVVLELPVHYACGSAEYFAKGAISLLHSLGCIHAICFGSESGDMTHLLEIAQILVQEPEGYKHQLQNFLRQGLSFPSARQQAFTAYTGSACLSCLLAEPNNILGIEYLKALYTLNSPIKPYTIQRIGAGYHETDLHPQYSSASALRRLLQQHQYSALASELPLSVYERIQDYLVQKGPIECNDFSLLLKYKLLSETKESLSSYMDVSEELANRILKSRNQFLSWNQFCELLKTKELTYSRISRALLHILLNIQKYDFPSDLSEQVPYARMLGFRKSDSAILKEFKTHSQIPIISKLGNVTEFSSAGVKMLTTDCFASNLYQSVLTDKYHTPYLEEHTQSIVLI